MGLMLDPKERVALVEAASKEKRVRTWRRMRAIELLAEGRRPEAVAEALGCARSSVYAWARAWREMGLSGLREGSRVPVGGVRWRGEPSCSWKNSLRRVTRKAEATARPVGRSLC
jgi:hypothetical protein